MLLAFENTNYIMSKEELEPDEKFLSHNETGFDVAFGLTPLNYNYQ